MSQQAINCSSNKPIKVTFLYDLYLLCIYKTMSLKTVDFKETVANVRCLSLELFG